MARDNNTMLGGGVIVSPIIYNMRGLYNRNPTPKT